MDSSFWVLKTNRRPTQFLNASWMNCLAVGLKRSKTTPWKILYRSMPVKNVGKSGDVKQRRFSKTAPHLMTRITEKLRKHKRRIECEIVSSFGSNG